MLGQETFQQAFCLMCVLLKVVSCGKIHLSVVDHNSSTVHLACQYDGDVTNNVYFDIFKNGTKCLHITQAGHPADANQSCRFEKLTGTQKNIVHFISDLPKICGHQDNFACIVRNDKEAENSTIVSAMSDQPEMTINEGEAIQGVCKPVPISCTVNNMCDIGEVEIVPGEGVHLGPLKTQSSKIPENGRQSVTVTTTAVFLKEGKFELACRNRMVNASRTTVTVDVKFAVADPEKKEKLTGPGDGNSGQVSSGSSHLGLSIGIPLAFTVLTSVAFGVGCWKLRKSREGHIPGEQDAALEPLDKKAE